MQENEIDVTDVQEKGLTGKIKDWSYENWQTILIILIVLIVGVSAYNYNQQGENTDENSEAVALLDDESENKPENNNDNEENNDNEQGESSVESDVVSNSQEEETEKADEEKAESEDNKTEEPVDNETEDNDEEKGEVLSSSSNDSGEIYTTTASRGEGITHLARHALKKYLEDINNGSELTTEHRIYIEDYLQNKTGSQKLETGDQKTFSKNLIQEAILNAKELSPKSLKNLSKYTKNIR